jgi:4-carboxymuconolactone decarboxylase
VAAQKHGLPRMKAANSVARAMKPSRPARLASARGLAPATRAACCFAATMVRGDDAAASAALRTLRETGAPRRVAEESALMLMLYGGFPAALEGLRALNAAWPGRARRSREGGPPRWRTRGDALCRRVYGDAYARLLPAVRALHPDLAVWMVEHGYGRVLSRPGLATRERELVTVAALAALGWERQLVSHVLGAERVGASRAAVGEALAIGGDAGDARARAIAQRTWERANRAAALPPGVSFRGVAGGPKGTRPLRNRAARGARAR